MVNVLNSRELLGKDFRGIPDSIILAFNTLIVRHWNGISSCFKKDEVFKYIQYDGISEEDAIKNHWLDVEPIYRANGFSVKYDIAEGNFTFCKA